MGQTKTIRLFGVDITVDYNDDDDHYSPVQTPDHQHMTTIHETSTKTKSYSTTTPHQQEEDDYPIPKKPKILRLFGVDIPIEEAAPAPMPPALMPHNPNQEENEALAAPIPAQGNIPELLFEKVLTKTDVARGQNRLLITKTHNLMAALTNEERRKVEVNEGDFLRVPTTVTSEVEYTLHLKWWPTSNALVLKHDWWKLVHANGLQQGDQVEGRGYRDDATHQFRLLFNIIRNPLNQ